MHVSLVCFGLFVSYNKCTKIIQDVNNRGNWVKVFRKPLCTIFANFYSVWQCLLRKKPRQTKHLPIGIK